MSSANLSYNQVPATHCDIGSQYIMSIGNSSLSELQWLVNDERVPGYKPRNDCWVMCPVV